MTASRTQDWRRLCCLPPTPTRTDAFQLTSFHSTNQGFANVIDQQTCLAIVISSSSLPCAVPSHDHNHDHVSVQHSYRATSTFFWLLSEHRRRPLTMAHLASIRTLIISTFLLFLALAHSATAFTVTISDKDELRQTCSGMIAGGDSRIQAFFHKESKGTVATMFYEFADFDKLGKLSNDKDAFGFQLKSYVCTPNAVAEKLCTNEQLGNFIVDQSRGNATTVQLQRLDFGASGTTEDKILVSMGKVAIEMLHGGC